MNRLPRTADEILARAAELGHVPSVIRKDGDNPAGRIVIACTCGYESRNRRSESAAREALAWHLGKAIGQAHDLTNGKEAARPPVRAAARREDVRPTSAGMESA